MNWSYRTASDGFGYCFQLPSLGLPDPDGEWVVVDAAVTTRDTSKIPYDAKVFSQPCMRFPSKGIYTMPIKHEGAVWYLPMVDFHKSPRMGRKEKKTEFFTVRVQRLPLSAHKESGIQTPPRPSTACSSSSSTATLDESDCDSSPTKVDSPAGAAASLVSSLSNVSLASSSAYTSQTSSTALSSATSSSSRTKLSSSASPDSGDDGNASDSQSSVDIVVDRSGPSWETFKAQARKLNQKTMDEEGMSPQQRAHAARVLEQFKGSHRFEPHLDINGSGYKGRIRFMRYVNTLPKGDLPPAAALRVDPRLKNPLGYWSVSVENQTFYQLTQLLLDDRCKTWSLLTDPNKGGLPCIVSDTDVVTVKTGSGSTWFRLTCQPLKMDVPAVLKLRPNPPDYAWQPKASSAEASYIINNYQVIVEQEGRAQVALEFPGELLDVLTERFMTFLAECASGQGGPGEIIYACQPTLEDSERMYMNLYRVGIRLRDGGARFPVSTTGLGRSFTAPGVGEQLARFGTMEKLNPTSPKWTVLKEVGLAIAVPPGPHDIILRVVDAPQGKFREIEYVLRPRGSTKAIKDDEWKPFAVGKKDGWVLSYLCNLARLSFGRFRMRRPPVGTGSFTD